nr:MAG TPA: hypothetical protein [Caudoviricetes sp.]
MNKQQEINNEYYDRWLNVLNQINTENALAEEKRQFDAQLAEEKRQYNESLKLQKAAQKASSSRSSSSGGGGGNNNSQINKSSSIGSKYVTVAKSMASGIAKSTLAATRNKDAAVAATKKYLDAQASQGLITFAEYQSILNSIF